jgi:hypothetical protein
LPRAYRRDERGPVIDVRRLTAFRLAIGHADDGEPVRFGPVVAGFGAADAPFTFGLATRSPARRLPFDVTPVASPSAV